VTWRAQPNACAGPVPQVLFLPHLYWHQVESLGEPTMSISFWFHAAPLDTPNTVQVLLLPRTPVPLCCPPPFSLPCAPSALAEC
jgi:hypothetical protein